MPRPLLGRCLLWFNWHGCYYCAVGSSWQATNWSESTLTIETSIARHFECSLQCRRFFRARECYGGYKQYEHNQAFARPKYACTAGYFEFSIICRLLYVYSSTCALYSGHPYGHPCNRQLTAIKKGIPWPVSPDCIAGSSQLLEVTCFLM